jgi:hypothetical protein
MVIGLCIFSLVCSGLSIWLNWLVWKQNRSEEKHERT